MGFSRLPGWQSRAQSADDVLKHLRSGMRAFIHGAAATPRALLEALPRQTSVEGVTLFHLHLEDECAFAGPEHAGRFRSVSLFTGASMRGPVADGRADFMPIFLSDIPELFRSGGVKLDAALLQLSPPDEHGLCSLGTSVDAARAAADCAPILLAEINEQMPRTHGQTAVPFSRVTAFTHTNRPLVESECAPASEIESEIGRHVAALVDDGATLQMGIGAIPDAALARMHGKHDLGIHTEMFSDRVVDLMHSGAITNRHKVIEPGRITTSFVNGTRKVFDFVDDNPLVSFLPCDVTNDTAAIRKNPSVVAINSALEVDLSGQVCADSLGHRILSGIGGQMDFIRGAALSRGGKPIIALPSTAAGGTASRICLALKEGAGVVTTRGHVHHVVTEYGAVNLHGCTLRERGERLISIAHPDFRPQLRRELNCVRHFTS